MAQNLWVIVDSYGLIPEGVEIFEHEAAARERLAELAKEYGIWMDTNGEPVNGEGSEHELRLFEAGVHRGRGPEPSKRE